MKPFFNRAASTGSEINLKWFNETGFIVLDAIMPALPILDPGYNCVL